MKISKRIVLVLALCTTALCSLIIAVPLLTPDNEQNTPNETAIQTAIKKAITYLEDDYQPYGLLFLNVMYRRFGVTEFSNAVERYDQMMQGNPNGPALRVFRRIIDHDNQFQDGDMEALYEDIDVLTAPALYFHRIGLPDDYAVKLENAVNTGDYLLTHAILALIWINENGCEIKLPEGFTENMYNKAATLIDLYQMNEDIAIEAAAFLYIAGQGSLVDDSFIQQVIADQAVDGGWGQSVDYRWHTTVLGLLLLLHVEYPSTSYPPMLAPATQ
ncbi:MAG: hypothetical protein WC325_12855 [Candidatus Bathyarchaeia archaeon]|jgi:hypothetical protein